MDSNSPFNQEQAELLNRLLPSLSDGQRIWLSGYLAAMQSTAISATQISVATLAAAEATLTASQVGQPNQSAISREVTVLYGSQTGNSQRLAKDLSRRLEQKGLQATLASMNDYKTSNLKKLQNLLIIVSTHGEGDPPDNALPFYEFLFSKRAPRLEDLRYSVLSLGDSSYEHFCKTGKDFDLRIEELGGRRLSPRTDCDVDYEETAAEWFEGVIGALSDASAVPVNGLQASATNSGLSSGHTANSAYSRTNPFPAELLENLNLNGRGSQRETRHLEISLEGSDLQYEPGDCLGIYPTNHPELVDELIAAMGWEPEQAVAVNKNGDERPLREALLGVFEITVLTKPLLEQAAKLNINDKLREMLNNEQELRSYLKGRDLLDLARDFAPWDVTAGQFASILRKIPARLYSIASSSKANPDEVHVTIRAVRYEAHGRERYGVCSVYSSERVKPGDSLRVYVHDNPNFKLPSNADTPIIMIGPGTGVAPFRAFLQDREETGASGNTWLFYGDQHFLTDFLYQTDWQRWLKEGVLTRMDVAFSRDTDKKVYVQHRMLEKSRELFRWLQNGACVYVCGDEKHMAHDVHATLGEILEREGGMTPEQASTYLTEMRQQGRYQRDVY